MVTLGLEAKYSHYYGKFTIMTIKEGVGEEWNIYKLTEVSCGIYIH